MKCQIQWIGLDGKLTPDQNDAVAKIPMTERIRLVIHYTRGGIGCRRRTVTRTARHILAIGPNGRVTGLVRVHGMDLWAEKYPHTVWVVESEWRSNA